VQEVVALTSAAPLIQATGGAFTGTITKFIVTQLGALGAYEPEGLSGTQWADSSGNNQDLTITGATTINLPEVVAFKRGSSVPQYVEAAALADIQSAQKRTGLHCDGTVDFAVSAATTALGIGTSDASMFFCVSTETSSPSAEKFLGYLSGGFYINQKIGSLELQIVQIGNSARDSGLFLVKGQAHTVIFTRSNGQIRLYLDGKAGANLTEAPISVATVPQFYMSYESSYAWQGSIYRAGLLNYALSEDKIRRYSAGERLDWEDIGGVTNTQITTTDVNSLTAIGTESIISDGTYGDVYQVVATTTSVATYKNGATTPGKTYRMKFKAKGVAGGIGKIFSGNSSEISGFVSILNPVLTAGWQDYVIEVKSVTADTVLVALTSTSNGDGFQLHAFTYDTLGALAAYEGENLLPSGGTTGLWPDSSGNANDLTITGATTINKQDSLELTDKLIVGGNSIRVATAKTPASSAATGTTGDICWDASYIYVCTATDTWKRSAIATW
jgi:hypothetical protein